MKTEKSKIHIGKIFFQYAIERVYPEIITFMSNYGFKFIINNDSTCVGKNISDQEIIFFGKYYDRELRPISTFSYCYMKIRTIFPVSYCDYNKHHVYYNMVSLLYITILLIDDNYLKIRNGSYRTTNVNPSACIKFINIISKLNVDTRQYICNIVYYSKRTYIKNSYLKDALEYYIKYILDSEEF